VVTILLMPSAATPAISRITRRAQIMNAALEAFVHEGYHNTSMETIAERVGVTKPVLYRHFSSKMELYLAIVDAQTNELVTHVQTALDTPVNLERERVRAAFAAYFNYIEAEGAAFRLIFESDVTADEALREHVERSSRLCAGEISRQLRAVADLTDAQAHLLATALLGMAQITARTRLRNPRGVSSSEAIDLLTQLAWRGLSHFPALD